MQLFSLFSLRSPNPNPNRNPPKSLTKAPIKTLPLLKSPQSSLKTSSSASALALQERIEEEKLEVRRPMKEMVEDGDDADEGDERRLGSSSNIEVKLNEIAKKMPMFEPERVETAAAEEKHLGINLELALYRAKVLTRNFKFGICGPWEAFL